MLRRHTALLAAAAASVGAAVGLSTLSPAGEDPQRRPWHRSLLLPLWAACVAAPSPTGASLASSKPQFAAHFNEQWGTRQLPVPPPGCVRVLWCAASVSGPHALPPETRQAVEGVAALAASKLATRRQGWHIEVVPSEEFYCGTAHRCIVVSTAAIATCFGRHGTTSGCSQGGAAVEERPEAALLFLLGHEMAHGMQRHAAEKAMLYSLLMLAFCWRYSLGEWRHRLRSRLPSSWAAGGAAATSEAWPAAWRAEAAEHKLQLADSLQQLSWRHEFEADAWACRLMGAAGVPPQDWPARLLVLRRVAAAEGAEEEEEEAAYMEAGEALAGKAMQQLTAGDASGAQALLDRHLRLPVPASWLRCMTPEERARLLGTLLHTHPPLGRRIEQVQQLSAAAAASVC